MKIVGGFFLGGGCYLLIITYLDILGISQFYKHYDHGQHSSFLPAILKIKLRNNIIL